MKRMFSEEDDLRKDRLAKLQQKLLVLPKPMLPLRCNGRSYEQGDTI